MADAQFSLVLFASSTAFSVCILSPTLVTVAPTPWLKVKSDNWCSELAQLEFVLDNKLSLGSCFLLLKQVLESYVHLFFRVLVLSFITDCSTLV